jgi:N-acetylglucosamine-6-sulfatase
VYAPVAGRSFAPLLRGETMPPRTPFLVQHSSDLVFARMKNMGYDAVRGERYKFIVYRDLPGMEELYDLDTDPYEMKNLANDPANAEVRRQMEVEFIQLIQRD